MGDEFNLSSTAFSDGGHIPRKYGGDGVPGQKDLSPPLQWNNIPEGTESLALIMEDLDAPDPAAPILPWVHWIVINIPPHLKGLPTGFNSKDVEGDKKYGDIQEGVNDFKVPHYRGPNPPSGCHRYEIRLYALDTNLSLGHKVTKPKLEDALVDHVLATATLRCIHAKGA